MSKHLLSWKMWLYGLFAGAIGGAASSVSVMIVDPVNFNLQSGWSKLWQVAAINALVSMALYLKQSPLPAISTITETTVNQTVQTTVETATTKSDQPPKTP